MILWINIQIKNNYLFLARKPGGASLMDFFPEWPWYLLILEGLTIVILTLMYLSVRSRPEPQAQHLVWP